MTLTCSPVRPAMVTSPLSAEARPIRSAVFVTDSRIDSLSIDQLSRQSSPYSLVGATPGPSPEQVVVSLAGRVAPLDRVDIEGGAAKAAKATARAAFLAAVKKPLGAVEGIEEIMRTDPSRGVASAGRVQPHIFAIKRRHPLLTIKQAIEVHDEVRKLVAERSLSVRSQKVMDQLIREGGDFVAGQKLAL